MKQGNRYSPRPTEDYYIEMASKCVIQTAHELDLGDAVWNLFWLSLPEVDVLPGTGKDWYKVYASNKVLQEALIKDVYEDEVLFRKLNMPIDEFLKWFRREDHHIYDAYTIGGEDWVETVISRAEQCLKESVGMPDNVIRVQFGRAAA